jgi:nucleoid DNA-binding protein
LNPAKRKEISQKVAEKLNLSFEIVDEIITCYFKSIQKKMSNLEHSRLAIDGLGTFYVKKNRLLAKLENYKAALERTESIAEPDMSDFRYMLGLRNEIKLYEKSLDEITQEEQNKLKKQEEKENYKRNKS